MVLAPSETRNGLEAVILKEDQLGVIVYGPAGLNRGDLMDRWANARPRRRGIYSSVRLQCALCHGPLMPDCVFRSAEGVMVHEDCFQHYLARP